MHRLFFYIPYSLKNILVKFENLSQSVGPIENWFNWLCRIAYSHPLYFGTFEARIP